MADTKEKTSQRNPSTQPQQHQEGQKKKPEQNPQGTQERRPEQVKGRPGIQEPGKHQTQGEDFRKQRAEDAGGENGHSEGEQHKEKHQGQKMPQQQKKDDQGSCGCG